MIIQILLVALLGGAVLAIFALERRRARVQSELDQSKLIAEQGQRDLAHAEQRLQALEGDLRSTEELLAHARREEIALNTTAAELRTRLELAEHQLGEAQAQKQVLGEELKGQFRQLASDILQERSSALDQRNEEALKPLREDLKRFGEQVQKTYTEEARERFSLERVIKELMERSQQVSQEANQLTKALRGDAKVQGDWGEMILDNILEMSGLRSGEEYFTQQEVRDEEGNRLRPDVVVKYPNGGFMVIDSKVSLTAYTVYVTAEDDLEREAAALRHLESVRRHIDELSRKSYSDLIEGAPDFVLLFIPNEPAYNLAMQLNPQLWMDAYRKRIVLINGTNLIAALRMAQDMWQRDRQISNVENIVQEAGKLYDKFVSYTETLLEAEKKMQAASASLSKARNQLTDGRGNLVGRLQKLSKMGVRGKKSLPAELEPDESEE
ncbi:DNA recombination protein RmuC [Porphyromonas sp. COT-290 OH860]|uniref:DNA recombination protein RmuC n=1 Tax=Porphyromonas sp. COT-290 OH860 TaxID=1515615 RepID=UPI00052C2438|nr:DNA recombination protein RmuC [Porphyromonas sp. COT-290 OH860]KGN86769.1 recombinase RmuC [Porphyromonas sp. COT-290 OH860]